MEIVHRQFVWGGVSEEVEETLWRALAKSGSVNSVMDIGARDSTMPRIFGSDVHIALFEPMPSSYANLSELFKRMPNVAGYRYGIGEKTGSVLYYPNTESFVKRTVHVRSENPISLEMKTFVDAMSDLNRTSVDFVKIDTEGYEYEILKNAQPFIRDKKIKYIQFEIGGTIFDIGKTLFDIFALFDSNWTIYSIEKGVLNRLDSAFTWDSSSWCNGNLFATCVPEHDLRRLLA